MPRFWQKLATVEPTRGTQLNSERISGLGSILALRWVKTATEAIPAELMAPQVTKRTLMGVIMLINYSIKFSSYGFE